MDLRHARKGHADLVHLLLRRAGLHRAGRSATTPTALPTGTETIIPSAQGALAGTYEHRRHLRPRHGDAVVLLRHRRRRPARRDRQHRLRHRRRPELSLGSSRGPTSASLSYTELGQPQEYTSAPPPSRSDLTDSYDQQTQRLTELAGRRPASARSTVDDTAYTYDNAGNVTVRGRHPVRRPRPGAVLPVRLPRPAVPGLVAGQRRLRRHAVRSRPRAAPRPLLGRLLLQRRRTT